MRHSAPRTIPSPSVRRVLAGLPCSNNPSGKTPPRATARRASANRRRRPTYRPGAGAPPVAWSGAILAMPESEVGGDFFLSLGIATRIAGVVTQNTGMAAAVATGTTQRRSVRAPQTTSAAAATRRSHSGGKRKLYQSFEPAPASCDVVRNFTQSHHALWAMANDTAEIIAVAPRAQASDRHSRRTTNQSSETPGVTFVSRPMDHRAGYSKPRTHTVARSRFTLPWYSSSGTGRKTSQTNAMRLVSQTRLTMRKLAHTA